MDRNREPRRPNIVGSNGFNRRRHRTNTLRDSPDEDGGLELQDTVRLRDRLKKDRDRDRDRERERERDLRERPSRSKRRRAERLGGDETSEDSVNDEEDDEDEENTSASAVRLLTPVVNSVPNHYHHSFSQQQHNSTSTSTNITNSTNHHHLQHRKTSPPSSASGKIFRAPPPVWKSGEEMISVSVPRKARSASTKRSHDWISSSSNNNSGGGGGEKIPRQVSGSPVRQGLVGPAPTPLPAAPTSPSSSNASVRKKLKPSVNLSGPKLKPPKVGSSSKPSSSNPEELEIEIAEVLYGLMTQSQGPPSRKEESARDVNRPNNSSPISNSTSTANPISAVAPKRKRPRQIPENTDQKPKSDISSPHLVKTTEENGCEIGGNSVNSQGLALEQPPELVEVKPVAEELREMKDLMAEEKDEVCAPEEKETAAVKVDDRRKTDSPTATTSVINTAITMVSDMENHKEEKFEIDLMAPPRQVKLSPDRESRVDPKSELVDEKKVLSVESVVMKEKEDEDKSGKSHLHLVAEEIKCIGSGEDAEPHKVIENGGRPIDLEKPERDGIAGVNESGDKMQVQSQKNLMPVRAAREDLTEKPGHSTSLPLPMSMASWPGGFPPVGYMAAPLQGVVSMDTSSMTPTPIQPLFSQPRPKRCATHCHIARNIHCLQQFMKMNPFWPAPAGPATLFGSKPCNFSVMPSADLQGNITVRGVSNMQDKGQILAAPPSNGGKEKGSQPVSVSDSAPRKQQIVIQQPVPPNNLVGPTAFIFPMNQQQAVVAGLPGAPKSPVTGTLTNTTSSVSTSVSPTGAGTAAAGMSFNYQNVAANETQYLAILQNGAYPFPIPAAVGAPPNYRGTSAQAVPLFNGSYFSSQMIHPSQLQHSQPTSNQQWQLLQTQQNGSQSNVPLSSHKHLHSQQLRPQSSSLSSGSGSANIQNFGGQKTQQPQQLQQSLNQNQYRHSSRPRQLDSEMGSEDGPSTTDGRGSRAPVNIYGSNFAMPIYPQSYPLMAQPAVTMSGNNNQNEKKAHLPQQQGVQSSGVEPLPVQSFAMSFGPINGTTGSGIDISSVAQNHGMFKNSPEATRQNIQMIAAVAAAQQKKSFRISEDGKSGPVDSSVANDERKGLSGNLSGVGQSITFTRSEMADGPTTSVQANSVIESSARSPSLVSATSRSSRTMTNNTVGAINVPNVHIQQQQLATTAVNLSKVQASTNGSMFPEHLTSSSAMSAKFSNALPGFPQNFVQSNSVSPVQSPQWKTSTRPSASSALSSLGSSPGTSHKNLHQQQSRTQSQIQNQISFGGSQKPSSMSQGLAPLSSNQGPPSPMMVGSPTTSSISKGASGSPRTSTSTSNKMSQTSSLSTQQPKKVVSITSQKSPSILGNPHITSSSSSNSAKLQIPQQPQQLPKTIQQAQLFFSNPYGHSQSPHPASTSSTTSSPGGYYMQQRRRPDQHQQSPGAPVTSVSGMGTNDPAKAMAAATGHIKSGGGLTSQGNIMQASQFAVQSTGGTILPAGFSYVQPVPAAVPVKVAEQKQPTARENMHAWQSEKK